MEIVYIIFIGMISSKIASKIVGIGLQCRRDTPPLTHIFTVGACGTRPRRGPPAALPRKACHGMLGVRIAQPQVVGAS